MVNVGILDKDEVYMERLKASISVMAGVNIIYAIDSFEALSAAVLKDYPHLLLLELLGQDPQILENIHTSWPAIEILILSDKNDLGTVRDSLRNGAASYVHKETAPCFLCRAIDLTFNGGSFVSPEISKALMRGRFGPHKNLDHLSVRELQIAEGLLNGLDYKVIAEKHKLSLESFHVKLKRIYRKLQIHSRGELLTMLST